MIRAAAITTIIFILTACSPAQTDWSGVAKGVGRIINE